MTFHFKMQADSALSILKGLVRSDKPVAPTEKKWGDNTAPAENFVRIQLKQLEEQKEAAEKWVKPVEWKPPELELYAVVVTPAQREEIERAINAVKLRQRILDEGEALSSICREY